MPVVIATNGLGIPVVNTPGATPQDVSYNGLGVPIVVVSSGGVPMDLGGPAGLFPVGTAGAWGEVAPAYLWQDVARTTPVTAAGQPVGSWLLRTATGVIYAEQSTAGLRPTYQEGSGLRWLAFDGVDKFLVTPAIDFSTTDKVTVFAGVRKLSDAARGIVAELNVGVMNCFTLAAPNFAGANYAFSTGGSIANAGVSNVTASAADSAVLCGLGDISGDTAVLRRNGVSSATGAADQGTGNYSNAAINIGRRGGASLPFNGNLYGLIIRGAASTNAEIAAAEQWMGGRVGLSFASTFPVTDVARLMEDLTPRLWEDGTPNMLEA